MVVMILERVPVGLRGELTRWLLEPRAGVFVGTVSAAVRERLWERACRRVGAGGGLLVCPADTEQGFVLRVCGSPRRRVVDFDGLQLIQVQE